MTNTTTDTIYVEVAGTNATIGGQHGTVTGVHYANGRAIGAFVRLDGPTDANGTYTAPGPMLYVTLGAKTGERGVWREVAASRVIDRDEFDRINDLDTLRADLGWK